MTCKKGRAHYFFPFFKKRPSALFFPLLQKKAERIVFSSLKEIDNSCLQFRGKERVSLVPLVMYDSLPL
jgi:hypothetical protein